MAMTVESIRRVSPERSYLLLKEPTFGIIGKEFELLTKEEIKRKRVANTAGIEREDLLSEGNTLFRNVAAMATLVKNQTHFELEDIRNARLIYTIVDHFLQSQAKLLNNRLGGLQEFMLDDFENLTKLANMMLHYIDIRDRIDLMNAPQKEEEKYNNIFDFILGNHADSTMSTVVEEVEQERGFQSPFSSILTTRRHVNRIDRFK